MHRSSSKKVWFLLAAGLAAAVGLHSLRGASTSSGVLVGRVWVDKLPSKDTDHVEAFVVIDDPSMGAFQRASSFEGSFELFKYEPKGEGKLVMLFPQSKKKYDVAYDAKACDERGFDYCLSLDGAPRGAQKYVSKKGWEIEGDSPAEIESRLEEWKAKNFPQD